MQLARPIACCTVVALGCAGSASGPWPPTPCVVTFVVERGPYIDAALRWPDSTLRFFFPADEACRRLIVDGTDVEYVADSLPGLVRGAQGECRAVGIGSLKVWRDRRPRQRYSVPLPRDDARFEKIYEDGDLFLLRGRFLLANQIGWAGGWDSVVAVPANDACRPLVERGNATMEFRVAGRQPYRLVSGEGECPVEVFAKPLPVGTTGAKQEDAGP